MESKRKEKTEGLIEFYDSFNDLFQFFCDNTTIHGTIRMNCSKRNKMKTGFWVVLFVFTFGMMYWQFGLMTREYWSHPTSIGLSSQTKSKIFPAITICNLNPYRFDEVNDHINQLDTMAEEALYSLFGYKGSKTIEEKQAIIDLLDIMGDMPVQINESFQLDTRIRLVKLQEKSLDPTIPEQKPFKVGFKLCNSSGGDCYYRSFWSGVDAIQDWYKFHFINIMSDIPMVLELGGGGEIIKDFIFTCEFNGKSCFEREYNHFHHPIYGSCFTFNSEGKDDFWKSSRTGQQHGLSLTLKTEQNNNLPILSTTAGARVMVHNPFQSPLVEHEGFDIWPGTETSISVKQDELNHLGGVYGQCTTDGSDVDVKLVYNSSYTVQACQQSCFQYKMIELCGCGYYFYPLPPGSEHCNYNKYPGWGHCYYKLNEKMIDYQLSCFTKCKRHCTSDISKINLYYEDQGHRSFDETPVISVTLFLSNMGAQWSLWFGSSVLSVAEIAELVFDAAAMLIIAVYQLKKKKTNRNDSPQVDMPVSAISGEPMASMSVMEKGESLVYNADIDKCNYKEKGMDT
ncbi:epithelial sodium channel subunit delta [Discoglossus pictus]